MLFNSLEFLLGFLPVAYLVFWSLRGAQARYVWLTISGYVFYGWWDPRFTLLMAFSTLVSFAAGLGMARAPLGSRQRRAWLVVPVVVDLSLLGFFKYANFALDTVRQVGGWAGAPVSLPHLDIILPIGISFYTFHTISYIVDAYRGVITPTRNLWEYAAYVSLFSQLVAGPIVRFRQVEADLEQLGADSRTRWLRRGLAFFVIGLVEKVLVADTLAALVDPAFAAWRSLSTGGAWLATLGYTFQLLFDFSGYSTMAVGLGFLFGIRIPQNFNAPYQSLDPSEFWQRWHISLSSCLRDYVYIPFGGNRLGVALTYRNLMLTMLIGGLWHGAAWTFVAWGAYHGVLLCAHRLARPWWDALPALVRQAGMFLAVMVGWVFFRATSFTEALHILRTLVVPTAGSLPSDLNLGLVGVTMAVAAWWSLRGPTPLAMVERGAPARPVLLATAFGAALALIITARPSPFLYFQF
jgi:alginate O-acetyltransferase complex protein AlgI